MADDDFTDDGTDGQSLEGPKALRDAYDKAVKKSAAQQKQLDDQAAELAAVRASNRTREIADILRDKDAKPGWAKYIKIDGEVTEAGVLAWLEKDGRDDFGWQPAAAAPPVLTPEQQAAQRITSTVANAPEGTVQTAWTPERVRSLDTPYEDLVKAGIAPPIQSGPNRRW